MVELLTVIAVIGLLATLILGVTSGAFTTGGKAKAQSEIGVLAAALEEYRAQYGDYPHLRTGSQTAEGDVLFLALAGYRGPRGDDLPTAARNRIFLDFATFTVEPALPATFNTDTAIPTTSRTLRDPWGNPYYYRYRMNPTTPGAGFSNTWTNVSFILLSAGPDGLVTLPSAVGVYDPNAAPNRDNVVLTR